MDGTLQFSCLLHDFVQCFRDGNREEMFPNCGCDFFMKIFATEYFVRSTRVLSQ